MLRFLVQRVFQIQVDILQLGPRPEVLSQELQAGFDAWVVVEALQREHAEQLVPAVVID